MSPFASLFRLQPFHYLTWNTTFPGFLARVRSFLFLYRSSLCFSRFPPPILSPSRPRNPRGPPRGAPRSPPPCKNRPPLAPPPPVRLKLRAWNSWQLFGTARDSLFSGSLAPASLPVFVSASSVQRSFPSVDINVQETDGAGSTRWRRAMNIYRWLPRFHPRVARRRSSMISRSDNRVHGTKQSMVMNC